MIIEPIKLDDLKPGDIVYECPQVDPGILHDDPSVFQSWVDHPQPSVVVRGMPNLIVASCEAEEISSRDDLPKIRVSIETSFYRTWMEALLADTAWQEGYHRDCLEALREFRKFLKGETA